MQPDLNLRLIAESVVRYEGTEYGLMKKPDSAEKQLVVSGDVSDFEGMAARPDVLIGPLSSRNAVVLRQRLPWLKPVTLGLRTSAGFGDRMGIATPGHVLAVHGTGVAPIFAQQSVRENARTGRAPQQVMDDAMWGAFLAGWREDWGADADHMKTIDDIAPFVQAGYTFYTIDPSDHVDDTSEKDDLRTLEAKATALDWEMLQTTLAETRQRYLRTFALDGLSLTFDEQTLFRALAKYGAAVIHTARMAQYLQTQLNGQPFELEMSVDETGTTTSLHEHFYIASELKRLNVPFVSLAPRFVGRFEKGVDYIGDLAELEQNIAGHASIMHYFGDTYKLSLHTGSDKFGVYPIAVRYTHGLVHLKTAGTSYLEALRLVAAFDPDLFRIIVNYARTRYETDRKTYHVSASLENVPPAASLSPEQLVGLLDQFDARQVLHVTFGSVLDQYGEPIRMLLRQFEANYHQYLKTHFDKHLAAFRKT
jgi:hypothetical protein